MLYCLLQALIQLQRIRLVIMVMMISGNGWKPSSHLNAEVEDGRQEEPLTYAVSAIMQLPHIEGSLVIFGSMLGLQSHVFVSTSVDTLL